MALVPVRAVKRPEQPLVTVCIANFNGERLLTECIDSVLAQRGDIAVEIIVHDDASDDASVALLQARYPQVELILGRTNAGYCVSNNRMVERARGEFVLLLNNDAALMDDALSTLLEAARLQPTPAILTLPQYDWNDGRLVDRGCLLDPFYNPVPNLDPGRDDVAYVIGACLWIPRRLWQELGGFPEWFGSIAEDMLLCCRARLRGIPVAACRTSGYRHRQGASFSGERGPECVLRSSLRRRALSERNKAYVLLASTPGMLAWPMLATLLISLCVEGLLLALLSRRGQILSRVYLPVFPSLLHERRRLLTLRRIAQQERQVSLAHYFRAFSPLPQKLRLLLRHGIPRLSG